MMDRSEERGTDYRYRLVAANIDSLRPELALE